MGIKSAVERFLAALIRVLHTPLIRYGISDEGRPYFELMPDLEVPPSESPGIDARLVQLDLARDNLFAALQAIDELKVTAERNKQELSQALERIKQVQNDKEAAERELQSVRQIAEADIQVFKQLAGIPSRSQITRERLIGFILGMTASVVATGIVWLGGSLWKYIKT